MLDIFVHFQEYSMITIANVFLCLVAVFALLIDIMFIWHLAKISFGFTVTRDTIWYSGKQIDILTDTAKTLTPTITGFSVLAASGAGYLYDNNLLSCTFDKVYVFIVFGMLILAVAMLILLFGCMVDCSRAFDRFNKDESLSSKLVADDAKTLHRAFGSAVTCAKIASVSFFIALDIALLITFRVFISDH
jgi:hypothetical protein